MVHVVNMAFQSINNVTILTAINKPHLPKTGLVKSPSTQDAFRQIPGFIQLCWGEWEMGLLSHAQNAVRWLALCIIQKVGISTSNSPSLQEAVLQEAVSVFCYHACTCAVHVSSVEIRNYSVDHINEFQLRVGLTYCMCMEVWSIQASMKHVHVHVHV